MLFNFPVDSAKYSQWRYVVLQPHRINSVVWAVPVSLATTKGISFDLYSSAY
jgi:hypothetical protein